MGHGPCIVGLRVQGMGMNIESPHHLGPSGDGRDRVLEPGPAGPTRAQEPLEDYLEKVRRSFRFH